MSDLDPTTQAVPPLAQRLAPIEATDSVLAGAVYDRLGDAIVEGVLAPGEQLSIGALGAALGVSRTPLREALQRLARIGLVEVAASRYTRITEVSPELAAETLEYTGYQAGVALHLAMGRMDDAQYTEAIQMLDEMISASDRDDAEQLMIRARMFVGFLTAATANRALATAMSEASLAVTRNLRTLAPMIGETAWRGQGYRGMRDAMIRRDAAAAEYWFRRQHKLPVSEYPPR